MPLLRRPHAHCRGLWARRPTARPAFRRHKRDLNDDDPCRLVAAFIRRNLSFPAPCPFHSAIGKCRLDITDLHPIRPSQALATPSPQSSAPFSPRQSAQNYPLPTPPRDQFPIDGQLLAAVPRVRSSQAFGRRPSAFAGVDCSRRAGIRNPNRKPPFIAVRTIGRIRPAYSNCARSALAFFRSAVSKPSVNQP